MSILKLVLLEFGVICLKEMFSKSVINFRRQLNVRIKADAEHWTSPALGSLIAAWVTYCMTNFTGSTSPTGCSSSWQWQFIGVWTAAHHRTCRTILRPVRQWWHLAASTFRQPSTTCSTSLPAQHLRPSGLFSCRPHSLELSPQSPGFYSVPDHQCRLF